MPKYVMLTTLTAKGVQTLAGESRPPEGGQPGRRGAGREGAAPVGDDRRIRLPEHRRGARRGDGRQGLGRARRAREREAPDVRADRDRQTCSISSLLDPLPRPPRRVGAERRRPRERRSVRARAADRTRSRGGEAARCAAREHRSSTSASTPGSRARGRPPSWRSAAGRCRSRSSRGSTTSRSASSTASRSPRYREVKRRLGRKQPFPGGESLDDAALRYAEAFDGLGAGGGGTRPRRLPRDPGPVRAERSRRLRAISTGRRSTTSPNAVPFAFDGRRRSPVRPRGSASWRPRVRSGRGRRTAP